MSDGIESNAYRHNHYVPRWYQKRFLGQGQAKGYYLDLSPEKISKNSITYTRNSIKNWGPRNCFAQDDLYTTTWGNVTNTDIEQFFFGEIDSQGKSCVEYFSSFKHPSASHKHFYDLMRYISVQKLRTPKGLEFIEQYTSKNDKNYNLDFIQRVQDMYSAIWSECVWQIADASKSQIKFIISDHPVSVYNRECFPQSKYCRYPNDPDIRLSATHTIFPLSIDKILILTNLSWVRDPYQSPLTVRPNAELFRPAMFKFTDIQTGRYLSDEEVIEINFITKFRSRRYIFGAEKDWLFPEKALKSKNWRKLGDGYLLMPDPRHIHMGGEIYIGYKDGSSAAFDAYGHRPWQKEFQDDARDAREWEALERFKAEWSYMYGPTFRGLTYDFAPANKPPRTAQSDEYHRVMIERYEKYRTRPGERRRRRRLYREIGGREK